MPSEAGYPNTKAGVSTLSLTTCQVLSPDNLSRGRRDADGKPLELLAGLASAGLSAENVHDVAHSWKINQEIC